MKFDEEHAKLGRPIEQAARQEKRELARYFFLERKIAPVTAAVAATMVSAETFALAAEDEAHLETALTTLANIARAHAYNVFRARGTWVLKKEDKCLKH